jgi:hypothetical protein
VSARDFWANCGVGCTVLFGFSVLDHISPDLSLGVACFGLGCCVTLLVTKRAA